MPASDSPYPAEAIRFKDVYGVFALGPDDVQFRTGSVSGPACVLSDSERRGLLAVVVEKLLSSPGAPARPWNESEEELLRDIVPELQRNGIVEVDGQQPAPGGRPESHGPMLGKPFAEARVAIVGHGVLGNAVRSLLRDTPCKSITTIESSSVASSGSARNAVSLEPPFASGPDASARCSSGTMKRARTVPPLCASPAASVPASPTASWSASARSCRRVHERAARLSVPSHHARQGSCAPT